MEKQFTVVEAEARDVGSWRVRLSKSDRVNAPRHSLLRVKHGDRSGYFVGLGHEQGSGIIQMDFDVREQLGLKLDDCAVLSIDRVRGIGQLCWYIMHRDPHIYVPARLAVAALCLGLIGLLAAAI